jgi:hypothetical protein
MLAGMTRNAAANGHPIEFWLTVVPAAGIFIFGWASIPMVRTTQYSSTHLHRHPHVRRFAVAYVAVIACMLLLGLVKAIVGFSDALFTDLALALLVVFGVVAMPIVMLGEQLHSNRHRPDARRPSLRFSLVRYGHREHKP